jgi:hypothetical protein
MLGARARPRTLMNIVYVVSAYKLPEQLVRLVHRLRVDGTTFFLHLDRRSPGHVHGMVTAGLAGLEGVHLLDPHPSPYGGFGHVQATLKGLDAAARLGVPYDYAILLTGQDYPIKPEEERTARLEAAGGRSFLAYFPLPAADWSGGGLDRIERWHFHIGSRRRQVPNRYLPLPVRRRLPGGLRPFGGSSYWCLSRRAVDHVRSFLRENPGYVRFFRSVDVPDELFFHTILLNSPLRDEIVNDDLRHIVWEEYGVAVLGPERLHELAASPKLFARKFDTARDPGMLDLIDSRLLDPGAH